MLPFLALLGTILLPTPSIQYLLILDSHLHLICNHSAICYNQKGENSNPSKVVIRNTPTSHERHYYYPVNIV